MAGKSKRTGWEDMRQARLEATKEQRAIKAKRQRERHMTWKEQGRCSRCGSIKEDNGLSTCSSCLLKIKLTRKNGEHKNKPYRELSDAQKERIKRNKAEKYNDRRAQGLCVRCGHRKALPGMALCNQCRLERNQSQYGHVNHSISWYEKERKAGRL